MKIDYASDLHFDHWMLWKPNQLKWEKQTRELTQRLIEKREGEVLILAGDFSEWNVQTLWILEEASNYYHRVYFTFGNHDLYLHSKSQRRKYNDSLGRLNELIAESKRIPNVVPLIKNVDVYKGKVFAGDAMWYLPKTEEDWQFYREKSNDSQHITIVGCSTDEIPIKLSNESLDWYRTLVNREIDVMVSHVPPVLPGGSKQPTNGCYKTAVDFSVAKNWICGHIHEKRVIEQSGTTFYSNTIGYPSEYESVKVNELPGSDINFDVQTIEI